MKISVIETNDAPIAFYDGECGLCDRFVQLLLRIDRHRRLRFAALQGTTAAELLGVDAVTGTDGTYWLVVGDQRYTRSEAVLRTLMVVGGFWSAAAIFLVVPRFARDGVYRWVARNRVRWFGRPDACRLPSIAERARFMP